MNIANPMHLVGVSCGAVLVGLALGLPTARVGFGKSLAPLDLAAVRGGGGACPFVTYNNTNQCNTGATEVGCGLRCLDCVTDCNVIVGQVSESPAANESLGTVNSYSCGDYGSKYENRWCGWFCRCTGDVIITWPCSNTLTRLDICTPPL